MDSHRIRKLILASFVIVTAVYFITIPPFCYAEKGQKDSINKTDLGEKALRLSTNDGLLTLNAKDADIKKLLEEISRKTGIEIEIGPNIEGGVSISLYDIPLDEALKKMASNWGMVFLKEKGSNVYHLSKVTIFASSQNQTSSRPKSKTEDSDPLIASAYDHMKSSAPAAKTTPQKRPSTSLTIIDEKTGIKSQAVSNELIVRFKKGLSEEEMLALIAKTGSSVKTHIEALNYYVLSLPSNLSVNEALRWFRQRGVVDQAEPNYLIPVKAIPSDPDFSKQWALHNTGQTGGVDDADIDALEAWDIEQGEAEVVIAIIDTGVDYTHEDLGANIWHNPGEIPDNAIDDDDNGYIDDTMGWDFVDSFGGAAGEDFIIPDNDPMDVHGHGTLVAGIAGATSNNELGIAGVAWNCKIMPVRAGYKTPSGDGVLESDDAAQAIIYAAENGASVINLSWGDYQKSNLIEDAITFAIDKGALICAAAGNENSTSLDFHVSFLS